MKNIMRMAMVFSIMAFATPALSVTGSTTLNVTATAVPTCTFSSSPVAFGSYDGSVDLAVSGYISRTCTSNLQVITIALDAGANYDTAGSTRRVADGAGNFLNYELYDDTAHTTLVGDGGTTHPGATAAFPSSATATVHYVRGLMLSAQTITPGTYSDVVNVTLTW